MPAAATQVLGDRYRIDRLIASGGMGRVWQGRDLRLGRPVAVKVLRSELSADAGFRARFRAEATHAAALSHPGIAAVYDYGETPAGPGEECSAYLVMELVDGEPLAARLREGPLGPERTIDVLGQAASALAEAHRHGVVHRDVKPGNILVRPDGRVKLTDFGIAWSAGQVPLTGSGVVLGTAAYLAPEQAVGSPPSPAGDVYALGMVGYECLTGHAAFDGENPVTVALRQVTDRPSPLPPDVPDEVRALVEQALVKDPADRPADGAAFLTAVDRAAHRTVAAPLPAVPVPPGRRPPGHAHRRRALLLVPALVLLALAVVLAVALTGGGPGGRRASSSPVPAPPTRTSAATDGAPTATSTAVGPEPVVPQAVEPSTRALPRTPSAARPTAAAPRTASAPAPVTPSTTAPAAPAPSTTTAPTTTAPTTTTEPPTTAPTTTEPTGSEPPSSEPPSSEPSSSEPSSTGPSSTEASSTQAPTSTQTPPTSTDTGTASSSGG